MSSLLHGLIRLQMATSVNTAELYSTMKLLLFADATLLFTILRAGLDNAPPLFVVAGLVFMLFQAYLTAVARKACVKRQSMKEAVESYYKDE